MPLAKPILIAAALLALPSYAQPPASKVIANLDLTQPFATRSPWRFTAAQGPDTEDPIMGGDAPGLIALCLRNGGSAACSPQLQATLPGDQTDDHVFTQPRYLQQARIVRPRGAASPPLLFVQVSSLLSADTGQIVFTQALAYRRGDDRFERVYGHATGGHNNNFEVRYIDSGPLKGDIVSAEPTDNAPYGFWVTVNRLTLAYAYRQVLRYRSATHYGDGNPLAVIDSEMPNLEQRLGLWRPGQPLPLPPGKCPHPRLKQSELWCG
jgi:hypothetical protein